MNIENELLAWSQTVYGVAHSLNIANSIKLGNLTTIVDSLVEAEKWNPSDVGFTSSIESRGFKDGSIDLAGEEYEEIFSRLSENIVKILLINLVVLADECLGYLISNIGNDPPNYLGDKVKWAKKRIAKEYEWAANGLLELYAIRNAIVHNGGTINQKVVEDLAEAGVNDAKDGHEISLSFGDLFRYRRALRTMIGEIQKIK